MSTIADKLKKIQADIADACARAGRSEKSVKVVVVTKTATLPTIQEVIRQGFVDLGENRVQHLKQVAEEVDAFLKENQDDPVRGGQPRTGMEEQRHEAETDHRFASRIRT